MRIGILWLVRPIVNFPVVLIIMKLSYFIFGRVSGMLKVLRFFFPFLSLGLSESCHMEAKQIQCDIREGITPGLLLQFFPVLFVSS